MEKYKELVRKVLEEGKKVNTPKGPVRRILGATINYNVRNTLPVITGKKTNVKWALVEMAMFMKGIHDLSLLKEYGAEKIWEKQGLSESLFQELPRHPNDVVADYAKLKDIPEEEARKEFYGWVGDLQNDLAKINEEARNLKDKTNEEISTHIRETSRARTLEFENLIESKGIQIREQKEVIAKGELGPIYGVQWLNYPSVSPEGQPIRINQIEECIWKLQNTPDSRQIIMTAWNPGAIARETFSYDEKIKAGYMGQAPCHMDCQFISDEVDGQRELSLVLHLRSNDLMLGHPFNIIGYTALLHLMAAKVGMIPTELSVIIGDAHIYENHIENTIKYLHSPIHDVPTFKLADGVDIEKFEVTDLLSAVGEYSSEAYLPFELNV